MKSSSCIRFSLMALPVIALVVTACTASSRPAHAADILKRVADLPMPGRAVRFDYQCLDTASGRLYISHMGDAHVVVFDVRGRRVLANIPGVPGSTGVIALPALHRAYASASGTGEVAAIDTDRYRVITRASVGRFPDGIAYDPGSQRLFVSDESGGADAVIDTRTNLRIARIPLGGGVGNTQYDPDERQILVTVGDDNDLAAIDPATLSVKARYRLPGAGRPHGLYIDASHRLAFIACEGNARLLVFDLGTMRETAAFATGDTPDVLAFDPGAGRLYVACESGTVSVFSLHGRTLRKDGDQFVAREAHSIAVDPRTHLVYLPLEDVDGRPVLRIMEPR